MYLLKLFLSCEDPVLHGPHELKQLKAANHNNQLKMPPESIMFGAAPYWLARESEKSISQSACKGYLPTVVTTALCARRSHGRVAQTVARTHARARITSTSTTNRCQASHSWSCKLWSLKCAIPQSWRSTVKQLVSRNHKVHVRTIPH